MAEGEKTRLIVWSDELRRAHDALRDALELAKDTADGSPEVTRDLLLYCQGFCLALGMHHAGEDRGLFPELSARYPALRNAIAKLTQDHDMIATLLVGFDAAVRAQSPPEVLRRHLDGFAAIMESHFRFEERELLPLLRSLEWEADPDEVLGPL